jgi:hypothetical protein
MNDPDLVLVESGFGKKTFNRILKAIRKYRVLTIRPGWEQTPDGIVPPPALIGGTTTLSPWDLLQTGEGEYKIEVGTINKGQGKVSDALPRADEIETFTPVIGTIIYAEISDFEPDEYSIKTTTTWPINDGVDDFFIETTGDDRAFSKSCHPLWKIEEEETYGSKSIGLSDGTSAFARRIATRENLRLSYGYFKSNQGYFTQAPFLEDAPAVL